MHKVQWNEFQYNINAWFNFLNNNDKCIVNNIQVTQTKVYDRPTVGRSLAEWRPISWVCLPTILWLNVFDWPPCGRRPLDSRWSGDLQPISWYSFLYKGVRLSAYHRMSLARRDPWQSADRPTRKSFQIDLGRMIFPNCCSHTIGRRLVCVMRI